MKVVVPNSNLPRVLIIGGGFGGLAVANALRNKPFQVVLIDRHNYHTFQPLLYQVATGGLEADSIAFPIRKIFNTHDNIVFRVANVTGIDPEGKRVETDLGALTYDYLVLATGSTTNFFGMKDVEEYACGMKTVVESLDLRHLILQNFEDAHQDLDPLERDQLTNFVVVGGGPTGVETAGALAELKRNVLPHDYPELDLRQMEIHLIEAGDRLLAGMSDKSSEEAKDTLERLGVNLMLNTQVTGYDGKTVTTNKSAKGIVAATVIWAAGIKGVVPDGIEDTSIGRGNRLQVDEFNRVKGYEDVFAIGDVASMSTEAYPNGHPQVAPAAMQMGERVGRNIIRLVKGAPLKPFEYFDKGSMATIGRNRAVVDFRKIHMKGWIAWVTWMFVHLLFLIGFRNRAVVFVNWVWSYFTYDKGVRLIIRPYKRKVELDHLDPVATP
ncbi:NAD(P)/FAD-dependent oxidoreductase [Pontibacter sp. G13]|uniref:NAD(P)/FAD-dependent oxidoreductase n=1 Tax=Pontibacter sp. G13 TaxID=3074898 RepID=UPI00288BA0C5|nr:NAD(P)/FAD-dependent oxidoreductase [Pontibacter sp. G13]WNJ16485.1 NAD(P)/FAD-dependent oxidoreductase [Pontibacter sp. G13]